VSKIRIYRTGTNGDVFYQAQEVSLPHSGAFLLNPTAVGRMIDTRGFERMRSGMYLRYWRGRIIVARGRNLYFSEPMRYGLFDPRHGFVQMPQVITFLQPVEGGIYVGQSNGVVFLQGTTPDKLAVVQTGAAKPLPGSATEIGSSSFSLEGAKASEKYAVWVGARGYALGDPGGNVVEPQSRRLAVPVGQRGVTVVHNRRLTTLVT
jgi:hypothetical protein